MKGQIIMREASEKKIITMEKIIQKWKDEFAFCEEQEANNSKNKEYIIAHNHTVRKELIREFIKDLEKVSEQLKDAEDHIRDLESELRSG